MKRNKKKCNKCGRETSLSVFDRHYKACIGTIKNRLKVEQLWKVGDNQFKCPFCLKIYTFKGISTHIWRTHGNGQNHKPLLGKHRTDIIWNKGLSKETDERVAKLGCTISKVTKGRPGHKNTERQKQLTSIRMSLHNPGGKSKWYEVSGQKVQGTWERDLALIFEELKIIWIAHRNYLEYIIDNKTRRYTPDFYLPKFDIRLEVKGYWWGNDKEKMRCVLEQHKDKRFLIIQKKEFLLIKKDKQIIFDYIMSA
jgi:hypothetical protein